MSHKAGFVNIIGNPNVGKSTLMNGLVGEKMSIITSKAQTTRHRILGIVNDEDYQIVFSDTPGVLEPNYKLHEGMMKFVYSALEDADVLLLIVDAYDQIIKNEKVLKRLQTIEVPLIIVVNKIDLLDQERLEQTVNLWIEQFPKAEILPMSALHKQGLDTLLKKITELLPDSAPYFEKDALTDKTERFFMAEIIREKIFMNYKKEIPYSCEVVVNSFLDEENIVRIAADIMVARDSQKGILIGHQGKMLKKVGTSARIDMEKFLDKKVFLELYVKVDKDWRDEDSKLKRYGYL
ncbi:GTPase Era [Acidiluteibacter ferrifornacis]|uniref:GTPase Era n=1 Tax=Acidiluteibacter ferrifornacis TaxID=2692424 RepID=A0A6N9NIL6_9FLAO|nr:GTPase Era [Acidiluteibacter ferrifornacis]MBR9830523.1 GTPase Era [bacterium]NBG66536.1 GTPase Era [Acidiluteibacter ferrifornacis]